MYVCNLAVNTKTAPLHGTELNRRGVQYSSGLKSGGCSTGATPDGPDRGRLLAASYFSREICVSQDRESRGCQQSMTEGARHTSKLVKEKNKEKNN